MKTLLMMRHAKSSWSNSNLSDYERPLNKRGKRDAPRMGTLLKQQNLTPQLIIASSAERALSTAEAVALTSDYEGEIQYTRRFYHADPEDYVAVLQTVADEFERVMIVGHNPGMAELVAQLTGEEMRVTTANIAYVQLPLTQWAELDEDTSGELIHLWRPKELDD